MMEKRFSEIVLFEDIPDTGLEFHYDDLPGLLDEIPHCAPAGAIAASVRLSRRGVNIWAEGSLTCTLTLSCHRCLKSYVFPLTIKYSYLMIPRETGDHMKEEISLKFDELEVAFFDGISVELFDVFREQILLSLPVKQLCSEDCKGLCPGCGRDLNTEECVCEVVREESPFSVLNKIKYA